jgi:hypothetical protein
LRLRSQPSSLADDDDIAEGLEEWGINEAEIDAWLDAAEAEDEDEEELQTCYVYPANANAVNVFLGCQITLAIGPGGAVYTGIPRTEVLAVCDLLGIAQADRRQVLYGVQVMVNAVLPELNERNSG